MLILLLFGFLEAYKIQVEVGTDVTLLCNIKQICPIPKWWGPPKITIYNDLGNSTFILPKYTWRRTDLKIKNVQQQDKGIYQCLCFHDYGKYIELDVMHNINIEIAIVTTVIWICICTSAIIYLYNTNIEVFKYLGHPIKNFVKWFLLYIVIGWFVLLYNIRQQQKRFFIQTTEL
jgi:hypothetical protein